MSQESPTCYRCQNPTTAGMLVDRDYATRQQVRWVSGEPRRGLAVRLGGSEVAGDRDEYRVVTYRCTQCGALESFATEPG